MCVCRLGDDNTLRLSESHWRCVKNLNLASWRDTISLNMISWGVLIALPQRNYDVFYIHPTVRCYAELLPTGPLVNEAAQRLKRFYLPPACSSIIKEVSPCFNM